MQWAKHLTWAVSRARSPSMRSVVSCRTAHLASVSCLLSSAARRSASFFAIRINAVHARGWHINGVVGCHQRQKYIVTFYYCTLLSMFSNSFASRTRETESHRRSKVEFKHNARVHICCCARVEHSIYVNYIACIPFSQRVPTRRFKWDPKTRSLSARTKVDSQVRLILYWVGMSQSTRDTAVTQPQARFLQEDVLVALKQERQI